MDSFAFGSFVHEDKMFVEVLGVHSIRVGNLNSNSTHIPHIFNFAKIFQNLNSNKRLSKEWSITILPWINKLWENYTIKPIRCGIITQGVGTGKTLLLSNFLTLRNHELTHLRLICPLQIHKCKLFSYQFS